MPSTNPRINLVVSPAFYDTVTRLAKLSGQSRTRVLLDVLEPAEPFFNEVANLLESAVSLKTEPGSQLASNLAKLQEKLTVAQDGMTPRAQSLLVELMHELEAGKTQAPDSSNTGAKISQPIENSQTTPLSPSLSLHS